MYSLNIFLKKCYALFIVSKNSIGKVGRKIITFYWICTAGLLISCNCVTDILFRIEATLLLDHTQQVCTSKLSWCNIPFHKKHTEPKEVYIFTFAKEKNLQTI